jgi:hypothetical protein
MQRRIKPDILSKANDKGRTLFYSRRFNRFGRLNDEPLLRTYALNHGGITTQKLAKLEEALLVVFRLPFAKLAGYLIRLRFFCLPNQEFVFP